MDGLNIQRPRSALHSGDFTHNEAPKKKDDLRETALPRGAPDIPYPSTARTYPWLATSPPRDYTQREIGRREAVTGQSDGVQSGISSLSSSLSLSWAYKPPTSPLVQSEINDELVDLAIPLKTTNIPQVSPQDSPSRRHTLSFLPSSPLPHAPQNRQLSVRREGIYPLQAHQPRRSLTSIPNFSMSGPSPPSQTPGFARSRRPSFGSDASPLHASMVGSYEESILRGRMSTTPSKPLDFLAKIGVLGLGNCKPSLRCPSHVTLPFSAVFYSYASTAHGRTNAEDGPSPYVGQIDLENGLPNPESGSRAKRKMQSRHSDQKPVGESDTMDVDDEDGMLDEAEDRRKRTTQKRRSRSPKAPPGGSYRIPEKGQLQIIIKNQNKTAVKLFLVPYDLAGMEPGTKTFIRQRSYSAGAIIDNVPDADDAVGTLDRPILRYLVHLHICCPAKGRYFLYKNIRVVFANRVPDGKEKLRNEITYPEPRYSPYKPIRVMHPPAPSGSAAMLAADKAYRRRSSGFSYAAQHYQQLDALGGIGEHPITFNLPPAVNRPQLPSFSFPRSGLGQQTITDPSSPLHAQEDSLGISAAQVDVGGDREANEGSGTAVMHDLGSAASGMQLTRYGKLNRGEAGYGGNLFGNNSPDGSFAAESLLSRKLRSLGVRQDEDRS